MTKSELENGSILKTRAKDLYLLIDEVLYGFSEEAGWNPLRLYTEDLKDKDGFSRLDIVAVWDIAMHKEYELKNILKTHRVEKWDWERKEPKTGRVTLENVEVGDTYYHTRRDGLIEEWKYEGWSIDKDVISGNIFGAWYTKEEMQDVLYTYREIKKRKEEGCPYCNVQEGTVWEYSYCPNCGRKLEVE